MRHVTPRVYLFLCGLLFLPLVCRAAEKPKVRAVTAFVRLDRPQYQAQIREALGMLRKAKAEFENAGYEVQTLRITTQPFPQYTSGLTREQALAFFHDYGALAIKESFIANIGPAMLQDTDDPAQVELLGEILSTTKGLISSVIIAGEDGIHWDAIRASAKMVKYVADHSPRSQGNFSFAATAMLAPYAPFYPGSYHTGEGHQFSVGLEGRML